MSSLISKIKPRRSLMNDSKFTRRKSGISFGPRNGKKIRREVIKEEFDAGLFKYLPKFHIQKGV